MVEKNLIGFKPLQRVLTYPFITKVICIMLIGIRDTQL